MKRYNPGRLTRIFIGIGMAAGPFMAGATMAAVGIKTAADYFVPGNGAGAPTYTVEQQPGVVRFTKTELNASGILVATKLGFKETVIEPTAGRICENETSLATAFFWPYLSTKADCRPLLENETPLLMEFAKGAGYRDSVTVNFIATNRTFMAPEKFRAR